MKSQELIKSIINRPSRTSTEDVKYYDKEVLTIFSAYGWMSSKQFSFLTNISGDELIIYPKEGACYSGISDIDFKIGRCMPNGARKWTYTQILKRREYNNDNDYNLSNYI